MLLTLPTHQSFSWQVVLGITCGHPTLLSLFSYYQIYPSQNGLGCGLDHLVPALPSLDGSWVHISHAKTSRFSFLFFFFVSFYYLLKVGSHFFYIYLYIKLNWLHLIVQLESDIVIKWDNNRICHYALEKIQIIWYVFLYFIKDFT